MLYKISRFSRNLLLGDEEPYVFAISGVIVSILALFGIISNAMSIFIFSRPQMRSPINYILIGKIHRYSNLLPHLQSIFF